MVQDSHISGEMLSPLESVSIEKGWRTRRRAPCVDVTRNAPFLPPFDMEILLVVWVFELLEHAPSAPLDSSCLVTPVPPAFRQKVVEHLSFHHCAKQLLLQTSSMCPQYLMFPRELELIQNSHDPLTKTSLRGETGSSGFSSAAPSGVPMLLLGASGI